MTPTQRPQTSSDTLRSNYYANIQASGGQIPGQSMPPPSSMVSPTYTQAASMQLANNTSFGSVQMQTPPPTRGTSSRKPQQEQIVAFGTPSTIASRRFMTPQQPKTDVAMPFGQSPMQFPQLQFSPDMQQFGNMGPASAPVQSHSHLMWAHSTSPMQAVPSATLDDPFAPSGPDMSWTSASFSQPNMQAVSFDTPAMNGFPVYTPQPPPLSTMDGPVQSAAVISMDSMSRAVDPSLLYSSPARPVLRSNSRSTKTKPSTSASKHADESQSHRRPDTSFSASTVTRSSTSNLQRSNTTGTARPQSARASMSAADSISRGSTLSSITRTASPVKRMGRPSLGSISEGRPRQRTSVVLTVDENGRARTVTKHLDPSPTRSVKDRYPALYDSDSSEPESEGSDNAPSRPLSFIFDKRDERKSKAARLDPPIENLEGLSIPRTSSAASMKKSVPPSRAAVAAVASLRRHGSLRRSSSSRNSNRRSVTLASSASIDTCPMDMPTILHQDSGREEQSDSEPHTLWPPPTDRAESTLEAHNRRWSIMSYEQNKVPSISPQQQQAPFMHNNSHGQLQIRCICGVAQVNVQPIVQCQSCTQWSHTVCVGLQSQAASAGFTCFLCTRPPNNRPRAALQRSASYGVR